MPSNVSDCAPPDLLWDLNRQLAALISGKQDGATISTRLAEPIAAMLDITVADAKTLIHGVMAFGAGAIAAKKTHPIVGIAVGAAILKFLEQDRCA